MQLNFTHRPHLKAPICLFLIVAGVCGCVAMALQLWISSARMHQRLTARLVAAFGRTVDVGSFDMRWLPWPEVEAHQVTIAEDPQFGQEYFLRADTVVADLRWTALFVGKLELGTLTFEQPSLNLVRNPDGRWNVESWLPRPSRNIGPQTATSSAAPGAPRLRRIAIDRGRVNFRRGLDVRPFALAGVTGILEQQSLGRWRIALEGQPMRATVHMQEAGSLWVEGTIAGTSARLQPAELKFGWSGAAAADALRLLTGDDAGVRGTFALQVAAHTVQTTPDRPAEWEIKIGAQLEGLHRWDLAQRADSPGVSLQASAGWVAGAPELALRQIKLEGARTNLAAVGSINWSGAILPHLSVSDAQISWNDLLAAYRSFSPGVDDALAADGVIQARGELHGWPPQIAIASASSNSARISANAVLLARIADFSGNWANGSGNLEASLLMENPAAKAGLVSAQAHAPSSGSVDFSAKAGTAQDSQLSRNPKRAAVPGAQKYYELAVHGSLSHIEQLFALAHALGRPIESNWTADGALDVNLAWRWQHGRSLPRPEGSLHARSLTLQLPLINHPIDLDDVSVALAPEKRIVTVTRASALGANWQGALDWLPSEAPEWNFDLAADHLDAEEIDRWLGPRARPSWLARIFSRDNSAQKPVVIPGALHAKGTLRAGEFSLQKAQAQDLVATIDLAGRDLTVQQLSAKLDGGTVKGMLEANFTSQPAYRFSGRLDAVSAAALLREDAALKGRVAGKLTGNVEFSASGVGRDALLASLEGRGYLSLSGAQIASLRLNAAAAPGEPISSPRENYTYLQSGFSVASKQIQLQDLLVAGASELYLGSGKVDFARRLDLDLHPVPAAYSKAWLSPNEQRRFSDPMTRATRHVRISGVLEAMQVTQQATPAAAPALRQ